MLKTTILGRLLPIWGRRVRDWTRRSLRFNSIPPLSRRERDGTAQSHSVPSPPFGLRPEAVILDRAMFASLSRGQSIPLRGFSSTHYFTWNKKRSLTASLFVSKEREGFEPSVLWQTPDFETGPFDHSGISPRFAQFSKYFQSCLYIIRGKS